MGATEEQMQLSSDANFTHVSYILILYSIAFLLYLFVNVLLHIYASYTWGEDESNGRRAEAAELAAAISSTPQSRLNATHSRGPSVQTPFTYRDQPSPSSVPGSKPVNGAAVGNGKVRLPGRNTASQQVRDAEEFELEGLISDDEMGPEDEDKENRSPLPMPKQHV